MAEPFPPWVDALLTKWRARAHELDSLPESEHTRHDLLIAEGQAQANKLLADELENATRKLEQAPIPLLLWCPECGARHVDEGVFATKVHHTHACQSCGHVWRPAVVPTIGVQFLPGFTNDFESNVEKLKEATRG